MTAADLPLTTVADGVVLRVRLTPRARRESVVWKPERAETGGEPPPLSAAVTAPPEDGRANAALVALLARTFDLPKSKITLIAGHTHRVKRVHIAGTPAVLVPALRRRIDALTAGGR